MKQGNGRATNRRQMVALARPTGAHPGRNGSTRKEQAMKLASKTRSRPIRALMASGT
jgi:hypothetical protein